ncbi:unnamed protein product, partial [marine sediment metagenome]
MTHQKSQILNKILPHPDMAWDASHICHIQQVWDTIELSGRIVQYDLNGKKVTTWAMFTNEEAYLWLNALEYINDALYYYS